MFVFTAKLTKKRLIAAVVACGLLLCGLVLLASTRGSAASQETSGTVPGTQGIKSNADRLAYLSSLGWETGAQEIQSQEVRIPDSFDDVMTSYNQLQQQQGFDLLKYKGKRVMRYTYEILNHESAKNGVYAELLVYKNQIIGGDVHTNEQGGFIQGLTKQRQCGCPSHQGTCPADCSCEVCKEAGPSSDMETAIEPDGETLSGDDPAASTALDESEFFDAGYFDEESLYEDETASNPDGLPQAPESEVLEPR